MRTKTVYKTSEIAHRWAHRRGLNERNPQGNFYYNGDTIYSYGGHFPIARLLPDNTVLMTTRTYSNTTAKHIAEVRYAIGHMRRFNVPDVMSGKHKENLKWYSDEIARLASKAKNARRWKFQAIRALNAELQEANEYAAHFKLKTHYSLPEDFDLTAERAKAQVYKAAGEAADERRSAESKARWAAQEAERAKTRETRIAEWREGKNPYKEWDFPTLIRQRGSRIETSKGAIVPLDAALALHDAVKAGAELPERIGGYGPIARDGESIRIGCHLIPVAEMDRLRAEIDQPAPVLATAEFGGLI